MGIATILTAVAALLAALAEAGRVSMLFRRELRHKRGKHQR